MTFFRPEAMAAVVRWREVLIGLVIALLGAWWLIGPGQLLIIPAIALLLAGAALIWIGFQRGRFRAVGEGPGAVQVDEGQIAYFGPLTGGVVALREVGRLTLDRSQYPAHWRLEQPGAADVLVPVNAAGADALFDAFATLPGFRMERMLDELRSHDKHPIVIWQRSSLRPAQISVH